MMDLENHEAVIDLKALSRGPDIDLLRDIQTVLDSLKPPPVAPDMQHEPEKMREMHAYATIAGEMLAQVLPDEVITLFKEVSSCRGRPGNRPAALIRGLPIGNVHGYTPLKAMGMRETGDGELEIDPKRADYQIAKLIPAMVYLTGQIPVDASKGKRYHYFNSLGNDNIPATFPEIASDPAARRLFTNPPLPNKRLTSPEQYYKTDGKETNPGFKFIAGAGTSREYNGGLINLPHAHTGTLLTCIHGNASATTTVYRDNNHRSLEKMVNSTLHSPELAFDKEFLSRLKEFEYFSFILGPGDVAYFGEDVFHQRSTSIEPHRKRAMNNNLISYYDSYASLGLTEAELDAARGKYVSSEQIRTRD